MKPITLLIILFVLVILIRAFLRDYKKGLYVAILLLIVLPTAIQIELPGELPNFTIHRIILFTCLIFWIKNNKHNSEVQVQSQVKEKVFPLKKVLIFYAISNLVSLIFSVSFSVSLKAYLSFILENLLLYIILLKSFLYEKDLFTILSYIVSGIIVVAILAAIERYTGFNPVNYIPGYERYSNEVISTYPHRILMGVAMAMGWPIALVISNRFKKNRLLWVLIIVVLLACYLSFSRGAWLAIIFATLVLVLLASLKIWRKIIFVVFLITFALVFRPGVWTTLNDTVEVTMNPDTTEGRSYRYRWVLWGLAFKEIVRSPQRMLFGYGQGSHHVMVIESTFLPSGQLYHFWSWDNQFAIYLLETGFIGFGITVFLYILILEKLFVIYIKTRKNYRNEMAGIISSVCAMFFMMTNVAIFAPQLNYLFWSLVSVGINYGSEWNKQHILDT